MRRVLRITTAPMRSSVRRIRSGLAWASSVSGAPRRVFRRRLDAGLIVGAELEVPVGERLALPTALVEIEYRSGLGGEPRIAGKHPAAVGY